VTEGWANTGEANTHNKPAITKLFQDIRILHLIDKDQIRVAELCREVPGARCQVSDELNQRACD
jgi:hypothetical protein